MCPTLKKAQLKLKASPGMGVHRSSDSVPRVPLAQGHGDTGDVFPELFLTLSHPQRANGNILHFSMKL